MKIFFISLFILLFFAGCAPQISDDVRKKSMEEIYQTERDFEKMALEKGVPAAFRFFAADSAVMIQGETPVVGKKAIFDYYTNWKYKDVTLRWLPDFIDAAVSGDLGYTYGKYTFAGKDSSGKSIEFKGYFHTVWKKQPDGSWRFVWD